MAHVGMKDDKHKQSHETQKGVYAMKSLFEVCLVGSILICVGGAQESTQPVMRKGVSVQMPVADHAVEMRAADAPQATVVAITADGKLFAGTEPTEPSALNNPIMRGRN
jgi:hypothetical protein